MLCLIKDDDERNKKADEIVTLKTTIQKAKSDGIVYIDECHTAKETRSSDDAKRHSISVHGSEIKPEKMQLPTFSGNVRTYAKFKKDFAQIIVRFYADVFQRAYVMKQTCLKGKAKSLVENIDNIEEIWTRLDLKYGDKIDLVDVVISELNEVPPLLANDDQKFIDFVDRLEKR